MIVEIERTKSVYCIIIPEVSSLSIETDYSSSEWSYKLCVRDKSNTYTEIRFLKDEKECKEAYGKIKQALESFYRKDDIANEIKKYIDNLK